VKKHEELLESKSSLKFRASVDSGVLGDQLRRSRMRILDEGEPQGQTQPFSPPKPEITRRSSRELSQKESKKSI
jgi:hypothetical protein